MTEQRIDAITRVLKLNFSPNHLEVIDESAKHAGHAGAKPEGQTHYRVKISAQHFDALSRIAQHRAVMDVLADEFKSGLHALAIEILPGDPKVTPQVLVPDA